LGLTHIVLSEPASLQIATGRTASGQPIRILPTVVRYPAQGTPAAGAQPGAEPYAAAGPFPLVVFSEGFDASVGEYAALLDFVASAGFIVAAPTYPHTDPARPGGLSEADIVNHPADLRFVISALLAAGGDPRSRLHHLLDPRHVAVIGHSDGADVSLAVAANSCCRVPAVNAAVILSGAELGAFGGHYYPSGSAPLLVAQGNADTINAPACSVQLYDQAPAPKYYLNIPGAEHQPPYLDAGPMRTGVKRSVIAFLDTYLRGERAGLMALLHGARLPADESLIAAPAAPAAASTYCPGAP
jgi:predicted dienelactone hydrolase